MPKTLPVEDNDFNRDRLSRRLADGVEWIIPKRACHREELLLRASVARGVPPGEERPR
jgi:hypothetical protein